MIPFSIDHTPDAVLLRLDGELTIEQARALHAALASTLVAGRPLSLDAGSLTRVDASVLQVLLAATQMVPGAHRTVPSAAWTNALQRHGLADPFVQP